MEIAAPFEYLRQNLASPVFPLTGGHTSEAFFDWRAMGSQGVRGAVGFVSRPGDDRCRVAPTSREPLIRPRAPSERIALLE
jgi:hypothetical protein